MPVGAAETCRSLERVADRVVCPYAPERFGAVGFYYDDFSQTGDDEVRSLLAKAAALESRQWQVA